MENAVKISRFRRRAMKQMHILHRLMLSASIAAVLAVAALSASAQTTTPTTSTATTPKAGDLTTAATAPKGGATPQMIQEACQRQRARTAKLLQSGVPEKWGSEEPFTFDPSKPCP
jgi:transposase